MVECEYNLVVYGVAVVRGFNRYMVECECVQLFFQHTPKCVLIDTWWNVNEPGRKKPGHGSGVLIDTWWNVNEEKCNDFKYSKRF